MQINFTPNHNQAFTAKAIPNGFTKLPKKKLVQLLEQGYSDTEIADMYDMQRQCVARKRRAVGMQPNVKKAADYSKFDFYYVRTLIDEGNSLSQIAEYYKEKVSVIRRVLSHFNLKTQQSVLIDAIDKDELIKLIDEGKSQKEIAQHFFIDDAGALTPLMKKIGKKPTQAKVDSISKEDLERKLQQGLSREEIAKEYNVAPQYLAKKMKADKLKTLVEINSEKTVPVNVLSDLLSKGISLKVISKRFQVTIHRLSEIMRENNLKTLVQAAREKDPSKEAVQAAVIGARSYVEVANKLGISQDRVHTVMNRYKIQLEKLVLPKGEDIKTFIGKAPKSSVDEIAKELGVEGLAVDKVVKKENINVWRIWKTSDFYRLDRLEYIYDWMKQGDSPTQIGEIFGLSSERAVDMISNLFKSNNQYDRLKNLNLKLKPSPAKEEILEQMSLIPKSKLSKKDVKDCKYNAERFLFEKLAKKLKISDMSVLALVNKNDIEDEFIKNTELLEKMYK